MSVCTRVQTSARVVVAESVRENDDDDDGRNCRRTAAVGAVATVTASAVGARRVRHRIRVHMQSRLVHSRAILLWRRQVLRQRVQPLVLVVSSRRQPG